MADASKMNVDTPNRPNATTTKVQQPKPQALPNRAAPSAILVSSRQKGNPILNHVKLVPWEYADIPADYVLGATTCALFLSLKYHRLHPEYIYSHIPNHEETLKELSKTSIVNNVTLILCWSAPEAAHYLELFKSSENAQPTAIRSQQAQSYRESVIEFITAPRSVNKSDAASLMSTFGSLQAAVNAQPEQISAVPGWGEKKVKQWCTAVREDFRVESSRKKVALPRDLGAAVGNGAGTTSAAGDVDEDVEDIIDDENAEYILLASARKVRELQIEQQAPSEGPPKKKDQQEEGLSEGVMDALAKLRKHGA
ncbi:mating-type switch/DNA repair protein Swi10/Rad10, putative [Talaromyces stipitatus ATCC 10500]|uniref:Mating-type switch/DNA repair protein Swi10/Rad10, putative n=1 Tax=Talaromyces stipitatus (strain ATCC 10500 / CBS 375.48 / QM 6759 / NRRL 1006) TaxID=441959 RepID=B8LUD3_TALSN|nr:mating-type switch/DNA repair protein Swi10/Rad10, putative [Talaromyces stipitatus ATCC 10500]EED23706.1 mating-type switch/DNA repair protein Swi10/Rad10, putative [Talaromyces stipitatus ATCC 10500]